MINLKWAKILTQHALRKTIARIRRTILTPRLNSLHSKRRRRDLAARFGKSIRSKLNKRIDLAATAKRRQKLSR